MFCLFLHQSVNVCIVLFLVIMNNASLHICVQVFVQWYVSNFLWYVRRSEIAGLYVVCAQSRQSCPTLCDPMDCRPPDSVHGILQARILKWVAMPSSRGSSWPRDLTHVSYYVSCIGRQVLPKSTTWEARIVTLVFCSSNTVLQFLLAMFEHSNFSTSLTIVCYFVFYSFLVFCFRRLQPPLWVWSYNWLLTGFFLSWLNSMKAKTRLDLIHYVLQCLTQSHCPINICKMGEKTWSLAICFVSINPGKIGTGMGKDVLAASAHTLTRVL